MSKINKISTKNKKIILVVAIALIVLVFVAASQTGMFVSPTFASNSYRPQYCSSQDGKCIDSQVFVRLPPYPKDFSDVSYLVTYNRYPILENFTEGVPDEYYYKQPAFYPTWGGQGIEKYKDLAPGYKADYVAVKGLGAYPGDVIISPKPGISVKPGMTFTVVTFVHAAWGVAKYQGVGMGYGFPSTGLSAFDIINVTQNPDVVKNYFDITIDPPYFLIEPSWPQFFPNWSQKVRITIKINEGTPAGTYLIGIGAGVPPAEAENEWIRAYRLGYTTGGAVGIDRPTHQIFLVVE